MTHARLEWSPPGRDGTYALLLPEHLLYPADHPPIPATVESAVRAALGSDYSVVNRGNRLDLQPRRPSPGHALVLTALRHSLGRRVDLVDHQTG